jgi:hypothetical protein
MRNGYDPKEVVSNIKLEIPGTHNVNNDVLKKFVLSMVGKGLKHKIVLIDEADRVFPARFWQNQDQTLALVGLWQDVKMFNWILWTAHKGTGVDVILRSVTQIGIVPKYDKLRDMIKFRVYNGIYERKFDMACPNVSVTVFPYYHRWDPVV